MARYFEPFRPPGTLVVPQVAKRLGLTEASVRARIYRGPLKATWHNGELVVAEADLESYRAAVAR